MRKFAILMITAVLLGSLWFVFQPGSAVDAAGIVGKNPHKTPVVKEIEKATLKAEKKAEKTPGYEKEKTENAKIPGKKVNFKGVVQSVDASNLVIELNAGGTQSFKVGTFTKVKIPTLGKDATLSDLLPGVQVNVQAVKDEADGLSAVKILVVPGQPMHVHRVGSVTAYTAGSSITIEALDGKSYTFVVTADTKILPKDRASLLAVGVQVTVIAPRDVTGGPVTAMGIVVHPVASETETETP